MLKRLAASSVLGFSLVAIFLGSLNIVDATASKATGVGNEASKVASAAISVAEIAKSEPARANVNSSSIKSSSRQIVPTKKAAPKPAAKSRVKSRATTDSTVPTEIGDALYMVNPNAPAN